MQIREERTTQQQRPDAVTTAGGDRRAAVGTDAPFVSMVVPTHNRAKLLGALLESIARLDWEPARLELFVVGDALIQDDTQAVVESFARTSPFPVRYLIAPNSAAAKRNAGIRAAGGEVIAFTDDDCRVDPSWLRAGCAALLAQPVAGIQGCTVVPEGEGDAAFGHVTRQLTEANYQTCNIFYYRADLLAVGGFDEQFSGSFNEDSDLAFSLLESGRQIGIAQDAIVYHPPRTEDGWSPLRAARRSVYAPLLHRKHPRRYRESLGSPVPRVSRMTFALDALACVSFAVISPTAALAILGGRLMLLALQLWRHCQGACSATRVARTAVSLLLAPYVSYGYLIAGNLRYRGSLWW